MLQLLGSLKIVHRIFHTMYINVNKTSRNIYLVIPPSSTSNEVCQESNQVTSRLFLSTVRKIVIKKRNEKVHMVAAWAVLSSLSLWRKASHYWRNHGSTTKLNTHLILCETSTLHVVAVSWALHFPLQQRKLKSFTTGGRDNCTYQLKYKEALHT